MKMFRKQKHDQTRCGFAVSTFCRTWFRLSRGWRPGWEGLQSFAGISIITRNSYSVHRNPFYPLLLLSLPSVAPSRPFLILCKLYYFHCLFTSLPILYPSAQDLRRLSGFCRVSPFLGVLKSFPGTLFPSKISPSALHRFQPSSRRNRNFTIPIALSLIYYYTIRYRNK